MDKKSVTAPQMKNHKMNRQIAYALAFTFLVSSSALWSQSDSNASDEILLQVRPRSEWRDGYQRLRQTGEAGALLSMQRTRVTWRHHAEKWEVRLGFQDVRTFGDLTGYAGYGAMAAAESWAAWKPNERTRITVGRQQIAFDNERIVGAVNWSQPGRFHDGIRWDQRTKLGNTTAALAWDAPGGLTRIMAHHVYTTELHRVSLVYFNQLNSQQPDESVATSGFTWTGEKRDSPFSWVLEGYMQAQEAELPTSYMGVLELHAKSDQIGKALIALDWLEGDARGRAFAPFLGTNHRHYGWMDQFYVGIPANGMTDARVHWSKPFKRTEWNARWDVRYHRFYSAEFDAHYADEIDAVLVFKPKKWVKASFGWSVMRGTEAMYESQNRLSTGNGLQNWGWVELNFSPTVALNQIRMQ